MGKTKGRSTSTAKQPAITNLARPLVKVNKVIGEQIAVPGSFWDGSMSGREKETLYKCTIREYTRPCTSGAARRMRASGVGRSRQ